MCPPAPLSGSACVTCYLPPPTSSHTHLHLSACVCIPSHLSFFMYKPGPLYISAMVLTQQQPVL